MSAPTAVPAQAELLATIARLERAARPLDPGTGRRRDARRAVGASTERFLRQIEHLKAFEDHAGTGEGLLSVPIRETGIPLEDVIELFEREVVVPGLNPASGGHLAYVPGGGIYHSALADFLAAVTNKYAGVFFTGPGPVRMEHQLLRWVADLVGYPAGAVGNIASGGSIANLVAVCAARDGAGLRSADYPRSVIYLTDQAHHCIEKAVRIAGMGEAPVRYIPTDDRHRMRVDALSDTIAADRAAGLSPWLVIAAAGTTDTGAVDPLDAIGAVASEAGCWFHVDAAYGGFFLLTEYGRRVLAGIERSDSVVLDPHKSLFLPYGIGLALVKNPKALLTAHHYTANYMQDATTDHVSPADVSPELTKHFRALRMWFPLLTHGVAPFRAGLEEKLLLARYFRERAIQRGFEVGPEPDLSIVTFRWVPPGLGLDAVNRINQRIVEFVRRDGKVFISSTMIDGRFTLRMVSLAVRTHRRTIDKLLEVLAAAVAEVGR